MVEYRLVIDGWRRMGVMSLFCLNPLLAFLMAVVMVITKSEVVLCRGNKRPRPPWLMGR